MCEELKSRLRGRVLILGIGNTLRSDDGAGSILAKRIKGKVPFTVFDAEEAPENYLEKIIQEKPDTIVIIDTVDFGGRPGESRFLQARGIKTANLFSTHNASISLAINYLQTNLKADIIILIIQPKSINFGDKLSPELTVTLNRLEECFYAAGKTER
jgi:hydrogenase 3 maturation protease